MLRHILVIAALIALPAQAAEPVSVVIVGGFPHEQSRHDLHNTQVDDVLAPKRQAEIAQVTEALAKFKPTLVAVEWPSDLVNQRYDAYLKGTLAPLAQTKSCSSASVSPRARASPMSKASTSTATFPTTPVVAYAKAHGMDGLIASANADVETMSKAEDAMLAKGSVGGVLRYLNDPAQIGRGQDFYRLMLKVGGGNDQPGADLLTQWYRRNFVICANLVQRAKPGDHVVVFYGAGHAFLLRQCVSEMPGYRLVEADDYLPN